MEALISNLKNFVPKLEKTVVLKGCGHWTQQERAETVNGEIIHFLKSLNHASA